MEFSQIHYNFIVSGQGESPMFRQPSGLDTFPANRLFAYTSGELKAIYESDLTKLSALPVLAVAEIYRDEGPRPAFVGRIEQIEERVGDVHFRFERLFNQITSEEVFRSGYFRIDVSSRGVNETNRTHWAIKEGNLMESVLRLLGDRPQERSPRAFNIEPWPLPSLGHVAVMMPFDSSFDAVHGAIETSCANLNLKTLRVDAIYGPTQIAADIFKTIEQSRLVISDLTGRNPNVLYETGLAHARDRDVIVITQEEGVVPFDLTHIRYIKYLPNQEGLNKLVTDLERSIRAVVGQ